MTTPVSNNSSTVPLPSDGVFTGFWTPVSSYSAVNALVKTNVGGELFIQFSTTKANVDYEVSIAVNANEPQTLSQLILAPYFRVRYVNDVVAQSSFLLWTTLSSAYPTEVAVAVDLDAETSSVAVWGQKPDTTLSALQLDASGNLKTTASLSVEGTLNVSDADTHTLLTDLSGAVWENTDRLLYDLDIIANHGDDASANALALINAVETQTTDLSNALTAVVNGLKDISGSVSVSNQITGFATSAKQDSMISDLDNIYLRLHDVSGSVSVSNQITGFATESTLDAVATTAEDISLQLTVPQRSLVEVDFDTQSSQLVQGSGTWRVPLTGEQGWEYLNSTIGGATAYFYSNTALVAGGLESNITLGSLTTMWFVGNYRLATAVNPNRRFYITVYTKPQGAGDFQPWYRSSKTYQLPNSAIVSKGADVFYYAGLDISTIYKEYDHTAYELAVSRGPCASNEVIQFMAIQVDSATPANEFDGIVKHAGFSTAGGTNRVVSFTRASREKIAEDNLKSLTVQSGELLVKDASAVALLAEIANGITVQVGQVEISGATFTDSKLNVFDASASSYLSAIEDILDTGFVNVYDASCELLLSGIKTQTDKLSFQNEGTYETLRVRVENPSSGGGVVEISGVSLVDGKLPVYDASANEPLSKLSFYADGYGAYDLRTQITNSVGVSVNNQPTVSLAPFSEVSLASGSQVALATGSQVALAPFSEVSLASGSQVQLVNSEVSLTSGSQIYANLRDNNGNAIGSQLAGDIGERAINTTLFAYDDANGGYKRVRLGDLGGMWVENANGTTLQVEVVNTPKVEISGNIVVADLSVNVLNSSLDAHIYGSSDGTTWHHIKTNPNGVVSTNAIMETDANGALTSENVTGTETYNALHSWIKNPAINVNARGYATSESAFFPIAVDEDGKVTTTVSGSVSVQNATATQLEVKAKQYGSYGNVANNVASILPSGVTAGINVADWSYFVGAYEDYNGATTGTISLEYSFDNITYYTLFNTQIFPSGSAPRRANINKQDIPAVNWIRLRNGTSSTLTSVTLTLLGGSLS